MRTKERKNSTAAGAHRRHALRQPVRLHRTRRLQAREAAAGLQQLRRRGGGGGLGDCERLAQLFVLLL